MIDSGALLSQLFSSFWWLLPLRTAASFYKSAWFKGFIGEAMVNLAARLFLNKDDYHLIKNVTISTEDSAVQKGEVPVLYIDLALTSSNTGGINGC